MARKPKAVTKVSLGNLEGFLKQGARATSVDNIPTGHFDLDFALWHGILPTKVDFSTDEWKEKYDPNKDLGLPLGKIVEISGSEGSGKSSLCMRIGGYAQKKGYKVAWIDTEHSFQESLAEVNGLDVDELLYSDLFDKDNPDKNFLAEDIMDNICAACESDIGIKVIVLDSVANLVTKERFEKDAEKVQVAKLARVLSDNLGKVAHYAAKNDVLILFINQIRDNVGVMFGDTETTPGGRALKHICSVRLKVNPRNSVENIHFIEDENVEGGQRVVAKNSGVSITKNRMGKPLLDHKGKRIVLPIPIYYERHFPNIEDRLFEVGRQLKLISVRKGIYNWNDNKVEGKNAFIAKLVDDNLLLDLYNNIMDKAAEEGHLLPPEFQNVNIDDLVTETGEEVEAVKEEDAKEAEAKKTPSRTGKKKSS